MTKPAVDASEPRWTAVEVSDRLNSAAKTLRLLPRAVAIQRVTCWPEYLRKVSEGYGYGEVEMRAPPPPARKITDMDEALTWLRWLDPNNARIVWARANECPWRIIARKYGVEVRTVQRWRGASLLTICGRLNGE